MYNSAGGQRTVPNISGGSSQLSLQPMRPLAQQPANNNVLDRAFPCVKLRGIPYDAVEDDIPGFLGMDTVDILFVRQSGRFTGEALVLLPSPVQIELALAKNKSYLGPRYVEVFRASKLDYYKAVMHEMISNHPFPVRQQHSVPAQRRRREVLLTAPGYAPEGEPTTVVKLRGLPWAVRRQDLVDWFSDLPIQPLTTDRVHIVLDGGRPSGIAYIEFHSAADAQQALTKDRQMLGERYVEIFASNKDEAARFIPQAQMAGRQELLG